jgi:hypothetical protein
MVSFTWSTEFLNFLHLWTRSLRFWNATETLQFCWVLLSMSALSLEKQVILFWIPTTASIVNVWIFVLFIYLIRDFSRPFHAVCTNRRCFQTPSTRLDRLLFYPSKRIFIESDSQSLGFRNFLQPRTHNWSHPSPFWRYRRRCCIYR